MELCNVCGGKMFKYRDGKKCSVCGKIVPGPKGNDAMTKDERPKPPRRNK